MRPPRIRTVLLAGGLFILALPLGGIWLLRIYESALIRQTETELNAQGATIAAVARLAWLAEAPASALAGMPVATALRPGAAEDPAGDLRLPTLDLGEDPVLPSPPPALPSALPPEPYAAAIGPMLLPVLRETQRFTLAAIRLLDARGTVVATTGEQAGASLAHLAEVQGALSGRPVVSMRSKGADYKLAAPWSISRGARVRVFVAHPVLAEGRVLGIVVLSRTPATIDQALYGKRWQLGLLAAGMLAVVGLVAYLSALLINRPIRSLMVGARDIADGAAAQLAPPRGPMTREAAELDQSIRTMAEALARRADYIQAFAAEASHELKTPLAAMRGAIELLQEHGAEMAPADRRRFLGNLAGDVERLERLVRRLLDLARAESAGRSEGAAADIAAAAAAAAHRQRELGLAVAIDPGPAVLAGVDGETLALALGNLLDNVRQHAGAGARASIGWQVEHGRVALTVADDGAGISPANRGQVFDRFFTTARDQGGTGLGLAIARARLAAAGGSLDLVPTARGARFVIGLPVAPTGRSTVPSA